MVMSRTAPYYNIDALLRGLAPIRVIIFRISLAFIAFDEDSTDKTVKRGYLEFNLKRNSLLVHAAGYTIPIKFYAVESQGHGWKMLSELKKSSFSVFQNYSFGLG
jgi:hypothetical protein